MADRIQQRRDTAARWSQYNPILLEGEIGYVTDNPNQYKIGDGVHTWNDLPLRGYTGTISQELGDDENAVVSQKTVTEELEDKINKDNSTETNLRDVSESFTIVDANGNVVFLINSNGVNSLKYNICNSQGFIVGMIDKEFVDKFSDFDPHAVKDSINDLSKSKVNKSNESETTLEDTSSNYRIVDANGNVVLMLDSQGLKAAKFLRCGPNGNVIEELVNKDDSGEDITKKTRIEYHAGKEYTFGQTLEASSGVTTSINTSLIRHGEFSIKADIPLSKSYPDSAGNSATPL